jgi:hypothetical protein
MRLKPGPWVVADRMVASRARTLRLDEAPFDMALLVLEIESLARTSGREGAARSGMPDPVDADRAASNTLAGKEGT